MKNTGMPMYDLHLKWESWESWDEFRHSRNEGIAFERHEGVES